MLQCVAVCCSVLQCVAVCPRCDHRRTAPTLTAAMDPVAGRCRCVAVECVAMFAVCCNVSSMRSSTQSSDFDCRNGFCSSVLQVCCKCVAVCCSVLQCVAVCCSVFQCVLDEIMNTKLWLYVAIDPVVVCCRCVAVECVAVRCNALQCALDEIVDTQLQLELPR